MEEHFLTLTINSYIFLYKVNMSLLRPFLCFPLTLTRKVSKKYLNWSFYKFYNRLYFRKKYLWIMIDCIDFFFRIGRNAMFCNRSLFHKKIFIQQSGVFIIGIRQTSSVTWNLHWIPFGYLTSKQCCQGYVLILFYV